MSRSFFLGLSFLIVACQPPPVVKPGYDFSQVKSIAVAHTPDFNSFPGSGKIVTRSIIHHLLRMGFNVVEREDLGVIANEIVLTQSGLLKDSESLNLTTSDVFLLATITEFTDGNVIVIPIVTKDKGSTVTTVETVEEPVVIEGQGGEKGITHTTTTTETTTVKKGSITETQQVEYVDSRVGLTLQMLDKTTGEVIWSNSYWYNALSLSNAVDKCVAGAVKPLAQLLK